MPPFRIERLSGTKLPFLPVASQPTGNNAILASVERQQLADKPEQKQ
jgi:hypothetical protein